ncbi:hypothetical protein BDR26DRAFT_1005950 [Obelidium mucronatum]|nr:hypothetical protein BDR26DRAFT_1005950 [Obelidium mucronatum]
MDEQQLHRAHAEIARTNAQRPLLCPTPVELGDGLVLRRATAADGAALAAFNAQQHFAAVGRATADAFGAAARHPTLDARCFTVAAAADSGRIVSAVYSVPQLWLYAGAVPLVALRPEAVGTAADFRGRALVAKHLDAHRRWAHALGAAVLFIGGMPQYYARFGYDLCPPRMGGRCGTKASVASAIQARQKRLLELEQQGPDSDKNAVKDLAFRRGAAADASFLTRLVRRNSRRRDLGIWTDFPESYWVDLFEGRQAGSFSANDVFVLEASVDAGSSVAAAFRVASGSGGDKGEQDIKDIIKGDDIIKIPVGFVQICNLGGYVSMFELDDSLEDLSVSWTDATTVLFEWLQEYELKYKAEKKKLFDAPFEIEDKGGIEGLVGGDESTSDAATTEPTTSTTTTTTTTTTTATTASQPPESEPKLPDDWTFQLFLGDTHPCYKSIATPTVLPIIQKPFYWFTQITHLPTFLQKITPVLNDRLHASITFTKLTAKLAIMFSAYSAAGAAILDIKNGKVVHVSEGKEGWTKADLVKDAGGASSLLVALCHGTSWMRMVLGHRTASEIQENGDLMGGAVAVQVLEALFPRMKVDAIIEKFKMNTTCLLLGSLLIASAYALQNQAIVFGSDTPSAAAAIAGLKQYNVPYVSYDTAASVASPTLPLYDTTSTANFSMIILGSGILAFSASQWTQLFDYQETSGARLVALYDEPGKGASVSYTSSISSSSGSFSVSPIIGNNNGIATTAAGLPVSYSVSLDGYMRDPALCLSSNVVRSAFSTDCDRIHIGD